MGLLPTGAVVGNVPALDPDLALALAPVSVSVPVPACAGVYVAGVGVFDVDDAGVSAVVECCCCDDVSLPSAANNGAL